MKTKHKLQIQPNSYTYFCSEEGTLGRTGFDGVFRLLGSAFLLGLQSKLTDFYTVLKKSLIYSFFFHNCHYCLLLGNKKSNTHLHNAISVWSSKKKIRVEFIGF